MHAHDPAADADLRIYGLHADAQRDFLPRSGAGDAARSCWNRTSLGVSVAATKVAGIYFVLWLLALWLVPLVPAQAKLGPVYTPISHWCHWSSRYFYLLRRSAGTFCWIA